MNGKVDMAARRRSFMESETPEADNRFSQARSTLQKHPTGTAARATATQEAGQGASPPEGETSITVSVPVSSVLDNPLNARQIYLERRVVELSASIAQHGQLAPALACRTSDVQALLVGAPAAGLLEKVLQGEGVPPYLLLGGHYRKKALTRLDRPIELKVVTVKTLLELYALSYAENEEREDTTPLDDALSWQQLLDSKLAATQEDIAKATNKSRETIVRTLAILKLPSSVLDVLRSATEGYSYLAAYTLTKLLGKTAEPRLIELAQRVVAGEATTREIEREVEASSEPAQRRTKAHSRQHKLASNQGEVGVLKEWDSGRVLLDIRLDDPVERDALVQEFRKRWGGDAG